MDVKMLLRGSHSCCGAGTVRGRCRRCRKVVGVGGGPFQAAFTGCAFPRWKPEQLNKTSS